MDAGTSGRGTAGSNAAAASSLSGTTAWRTNLQLFLATAASVYLTGVINFPQDDPPADEGFFAGLSRAFTTITPTSLMNGALFATTLLSILVAHELGHYVAARIHKVDASLPFFIPLPILSPFGTMGAVIRMRGIIPTRRALLDIGAAGPLAGLAFAIPLYAWGVSASRPVTVDPEHTIFFGESLLTKALDAAFAPAIPSGMDMSYSPVAFGAWGGFFVTMINLLPVAQLDGGHVAYALFGPKQNRYAQLVHRAMLVFFGVVIAGHVGRDVAMGRAMSAALVARHLGSALPWLVWFQLLAVLGTVASRASKTAAADPAGDRGGGAPSLTVRARLVATFGLVGMASVARAYPSWPLIGAFFTGFALLVAMEVKVGVLRKHDLLDHPPTGDEPLDGKRKAIAIATLVVFALLFMPEPFSM